MARADGRRRGRGRRTPPARWPRRGRRGERRVPRLVVGPGADLADRGGAAGRGRLAPRRGTCSVDPRAVRSAATSAKVSDRCRPVRPRLAEAAADGLERALEVGAWPGGSGSRTGPCSWLGRRTSHGRSGDLAPLVDALELEVDGRAIAVGQVLPGEVPRTIACRRRSEEAELAVELPEPHVVAHPVGAEVDQPGLPHPAVVEGRRVARALRDSGSQCTRCITSGMFRSSRWKKRERGAGCGPPGAAASRRRGPCPCRRASTRCR